MGRSPLPRAQNATPRWTEASQLHWYALSETASTAPQSLKPPP